MQPPPATVIHEFGDFELDTLRRILFSRVDGKPVDITGRVMEALVYLVERPGQLVEKKALMDALWPHVVVEEGNLTQTIHSLRRVLGERAGEHRYIATVPGRGYRFVADVKVRGGQAEQTNPVPQAAAPSRPSAWVLAGVAMVIVALALLWQGRRAGPPSVAAAPASIAVLPFVDMSAEQDQAHFADGLSEEILNLLAQGDGLRVIARTSSFSLRDENVDIGTIAKRLAVSHVLEGSVRKSGERLRITAQLIDGATSAHVWSDTFDRDVSDVFGVQREIATAVAGALHVTLRPTHPRPAETRSMEAYDHYLQGRHLFQRRSGTDLLQAKAHFEKAVEIDPTYGRAWAGLAGLYLVARYEKIELPDAMEKWGEAAGRAIEFAPDLGEAHVRAAQYQWHAGNYEAARDLQARARALDPNDPIVLGTSLAETLAEGRVDDAIDLHRRLIASDPLSATKRGNLGLVLMLAGRYPEAQAELERALELSPGSPHMKENVADVLIMQSRNDEALKVIAQLPSGYTRDQRLAIAYFARGEVDESDAAVARMIELAERPESDAMVPLTVAEVYSMRRDFDRAFEWLDKARLRAHGPTAVTMPGWLVFENLQVSSYLKPLHSDPRWKPLLADLRTSPKTRGYEAGQTR